MVEDTVCPCIHLGAGELLHYAKVSPSRGELPPPLTQVQAEWKQETLIYISVYNCVGALCCANVGHIKCEDNLLRLFHRTCRCFRIFHYSGKLLQSIL